MNLEGFQRHIDRLNEWSRQNFKPFYFDSHLVGYLKEPVWSYLISRPDAFSVNKDGVWLDPKINSFEQRTEILDEVVNGLLESGVMSHRHGERYPVTYAGRETALATIDRAAAAYFGLRAYGQHLNGYVRKGSDLMLWIARRAADRRVFPNHLDNMVAGGLPHDISLAENLHKECLEEASVPSNMVAQAVSVSAITYCTETSVGLKPDTLYCYDLELPIDFVPYNSDGEVADFMLLPIEEVAERVAGSDDFKPNCNLVVIDFLLRHGIINPETPGYLQLINGLHEKF
ncbi:MAG: DUF4743 domain-containing protein [Candidatus Thiodiazotropha sp.]